MGLLNTHKGKVAILIAYYRNLLGTSDATSWGFCVEHLYRDLPKVEASPLIALFTTEEAKRLIRNMNPNSAPRLDGVGPAFYSAA
jgi:hypothetical protein